MAAIREAVPGDVSTEPVATAEQSHVIGRVGPPTIAQDATSDHGSQGVDQIQPGQVMPADTAWVGPEVLAEDDDRDDEKPAPVVQKNEPKVTGRK